MNAIGDARKLITVTLAGVVALAFAAPPALAQGTDAPDRADAAVQEQARRIQVKILGMSCPFCAYGVEQKLKKLDGVESLEVELESGVATLTMEEGTDVPNEKLKRTVEDAGFEAAAIVRSFDSEHEDWHPGKMPEEDR